MAKQVADPRLEAWLTTEIAPGLSPIKRKNYFTRLIAWAAERESGLHHSATWPRLPLSWTRYPSLVASQQAGMPRPWWVVTNVTYRVALLEAGRVGDFLRALAGAVAPAVNGGWLFDLWAWVAWDAERAWVFVDSIQSMGAVADGEQWFPSWVGDLVWVEWSSLRGTLTCRWKEAGQRRSFLPSSRPAPRDWSFAADDIGAMRALLASGPMKCDAERLPAWLLERYASGDVQIRFVPFAFEGQMCFPDDTVFRQG